MEHVPPIGTIKLLSSPKAGSIQSGLLEGKKVSTPVTDFVFNTTVGSTVSGDKDKLTVLGGDEQGRWLFAPNTGTP